MSSTAQQFDFHGSKEEVLELLKNIGSAGLRIDFKSALPTESGLVKVSLHHRMNAFSYGDNIDIDLYSNEDGTCHMNIVSSNFALISYGVHSKNITAIAKYIMGSLAKAHPPVSKEEAMNNILKLKQLLDAGVISQEEFDTKKAEYMKSL